MFLSCPLLLKNLAQAESGARFGIPGQNVGPSPKCGPRGQKYQSCVLKSHAECSSQNSKGSHMVQVMAQNHFGALAAKTGPNVGGQGAYVGKE